MASKLACQRARSARGFTLIELMIVAAIVAILAVLAYPSYVQYVVRSNRAAAESFMQEVAAAQERFLLDNRAYAPDLTTLQYASSVPASVASKYQFSFTAVTTAPPAYTLNATPTGSQASSDAACGTLGLSNTGSKTASGGASNCWK
ncbi:MULTISPECIES: type IV pilin protein [Ralstonia solanacearum species complex]|uniref:Type IV pilin protein n=3 Tax=Ralstonia solanacearum species complex TaxID=3116862 RepID=A0A454TR39_9RALS|nr:MULTISPECIES: type IV pilin protein [Ralstonia]AKZ25764.1 pilus assembly protein PilE [Ralstonia solanacearum]APF86059.1 pilus assembly protein PilE [Ralstonia solanacearum FJAT-1458]ARS57025.1 pilus assembly protein PilE [Ralstonia solanacearum FJAT-91]AST85635.1 type IV pilin protein [Ralstonia pseudosolanacearum]AUS43242.1 type IV pilin protein [Ralstonia solanacearum]